MEREKEKEKEKETEGEFFFFFSYFFFFSAQQLKNEKSLLKYLYFHKIFGRKKNMLTICTPTKDAVVQKITKSWSSQILNEHEQRRHDFFL